MIACNHFAGKFPHRRLGVHADARVEQHLEGMLALLEEIVDDLPDGRPSGGTFHFNNQKALPASELRRRVAQLVPRT